ncbi:MAG: hypothetical protein IBX68_02180 [Dehalococcoidia bacterium]|nr:hypothetical protein [Dehalococcoidia bacterium]
MSYLYTHLPQHQCIGFEERSYEAVEGLLDYHGRSILYLYVEASSVSFCDRSYASHLGSLNVKGYVVKWKKARDSEGNPVSEIEPVTDEGEKREISSLLRTQFTVPTVNFF